MSTNTEALREQFEAWARKNELEAERHKYADDQYDDHAATSAWWAWRDAYQAGHAAGVADERERCAQLCDKLSRRAGDAMDCRDAIRAGVKEPSDADQA